MQFQIGPLNKRITLQSPTKTADGMGGYSVVWKDEATVWAAIWPTSAKEAVTDRQSGLGTTYRVRTRYKAGVKSNWRITYEDRYFNIQSIINPNESNRALDLICEEAV